MSPFWILARRMLRYRLLVVGAVMFALVSAGSMGAGFLGISPVLDNILSPHPRSLRQIVEPKLEILTERTGIHIPPSWINLLPSGADKSAQFDTVLCIIIALGVLTILGAIANFLHAYLSLTVVNRTVTAIRRECFHRTLRLPLKTIVAAGPMDSISRIINDTSSLGSGFNTLLSKALAQVSKGFAALITAFLIDPRLAIIAIFVGAVLGVIIRKLGKSIRRASRQALHSQADLYRSTTEALQGLRVVKVHTTERYEAGRFHRLNKQVMRELNRVRTARAIASPLVETLAIFVLGTLTLVAAKAIIDKALDPTDFLLTLTALGVAGGSLKPVTGLLNDIQASSAAADRVQELLAAAPEHGHTAKLPKLPRLTRAITFDNISFTYPNAREPSLRDISLTIRHGETVAVVGPNGSGKTTLLALVPRLFDPDSGRLLIDDRDIRQVGIRSVRAQIGVVTQETVLFRGSVLSNIGYGAAGATPERIMAAARQARAHDFITKMSDGYMTEIAEQGLSLSGGQRQRIAIARAILRDPAILILDEATSMIDADSEARIAEAMTEFSSGRTCLIVAHRLSTVLNADRIVVMDQGRIVDIGTHRQLLDRCHVYQQLARHQLVGDNNPPTVVTTTPSSTSPAPSA